jgi:dTDP-4-dehydrorhamnose reductase
MSAAASPRTVLIIGASGFLGSNIAQAAHKQHNAVLHSFSHPVALDQCPSYTADLLETCAVDRLIDAAEPDLVINCAALANVDACEHHSELARQLNAMLPGALARVCNRSAIDFVHISTDAVFGATGAPYSVDTSPQPTNAYGRSKLVGESLVLEQHPSALVVRTNIVGWSPSGQRSLLEFFWHRLSRGESSPGFADAMFRPVAANELWSAISAWSTEARNTGRAGIRHATGATLLSKLDFGRRVARTFGFDPQLIQVADLGGANLAAKRALNLDVLPSPLPVDHDLDSPMADIDRSLARLRILAAEGYRGALARMVQISRRSS